jgi:hypothetical protein
LGENRNSIEELGPQSPPPFRGWKIVLQVAAEMIAISKSALSVTTPVIPSFTIRRLKLQIAFCGSLAIARIIELATKQQPNNLINSRPQARCSKATALG